MTQLQVNRLNSNKLTLNELTSNELTSNELTSNERTLNELTLMLISCALKFIAVLQKLIKNILRDKTYFLGSKSVIFKTVTKHKRKKTVFQLQHNILKLKK